MKNWWLYYAVISISLLMFTSTCPLKEKGHCQWTQNYSDWSPSTYDETFLSWWGVTLPGSQPRVHWIVWWVWKSPELSANEHKWEILNACVRQCSPTLSSKHHWLNIFWKNSLHPSSTLPESSRESMSICTKAAHGSPTSY